MIEELPKIPLELYVVSYMNKCAKEGIKATFDEICWGVLNHLPKDQVQINDNEMILDILKRIAILNKTTGEWKLKQTTQNYLTIFKKSNYIIYA